MPARVFKLNENTPDARAIKKAAQALKEGGLVVFPTETVYGIAADRDNPEAIKKLCAVKNRPEGKPFTVHIHDIKEIERFGCRPNEKTRTALERSWPGPLTAILKAQTGEKIGFRVPDNKIALELIKESQVSVVAPSANVSGEEPPTRAEDVSKIIREKSAFILDGGPTKLKASSKVIDFTGDEPKVLRR